MAFEKLISALIIENKVENLFRIREEWLRAEEIVQFDFIRQYAAQYGELPSFSVYNDKFKKNLPKKGGRFVYELAEFKGRHVYLRLAEDIPKTMRDLRQKPLEKLTELKTLIDELETDDGGKGESYDSDALERFLSYKQRVGTNGVTGLSTGHPELDDLFYGYQPGDLFTIGGRSGVGKTWFICWLCLLLEKVLPPGAGPILFFTLEMSTAQLKERMDCIRFKLPYTAFQKGKLTRLEQIRYNKGLQELKKTKSPIIFIEDVYTLRELEGKIKLYKPSKVFIDGSYILEPQMDEDYRKILFITRNLKRIFRQNKIPGTNTTQMKRGTGTRKAKTSFEAQDEIGQGMGYVQDSDLAITGYQTAQMMYHNEIGFNIAKGRRVESGKELIWHRDIKTMEYDIEIRDTDSGGSASKAGSFEEDPPALF